jgi:hypothetical protein
MLLLHKPFVINIPHLDLISSSVSVIHLFLEGLNSYTINRNIRLLCISPVLCMNEIFYFSIITVIIVIFIVAPCILKSKTSHSPTKELFIKL